MARAPGPTSAQVRGLPADAGAAAGPAGAASDAWRPVGAVMADSMHDAPAAVHPSYPPSSRQTSWFRFRCSSRASAAHRWPAAFQWLS